MLAAAIASGDASSSAQLLASLEQTGLVKSIRQWTVPGDRIPESAEMLPDVVFLDLGRDPEPCFAFGAQLRRLAPAIRLVACSASSAPSQQLLLEAMHSGVQDFLPKPVTLSALKEMLTRLAREIGSRQLPVKNKFVAVMGTKGGVGATTVTVNLGVHLSSFARKRVVLLDLARPLGNAHLLLDLKPGFGLRDAVANRERLDSHFFAGLLTRHKTGLEILGGSMQPEEWDTIPVSPLDRVVSVAQNNFDFVLADIGSQFSSEWGAVLRLAAMILVVTEANVPALWNLERRLTAMKGFGIEPERTRIIINRWHKGDEEALQTISKGSSRPLLACLPNDYRKISAAVNHGVPFVDGRNDALNSRYRQLAASVAGVEAVPAASRKNSFAGLFSFSGKVA